MSVTPFYLKASGHEEGRPFQWLVADFGLVDAVESGIVKIPRIPVDDNSGQPDPKYFRLREQIIRVLPQSDRQRTRRMAKPEAVVREAQGAMGILASRWQNTFESFRNSKAKGTKPVMEGPKSAFRKFIRARQATAYKIDPAIRQWKIKNPNPIELGNGASYQTSSFETPCEIRSSINHFSGLGRIQSPLVRTDSVVGWQIRCVGGRRRVLSAGLKSKSEISEQTSLL